MTVVCKQCGDARLQPGAWCPACQENTMDPELFSSLDRHPSGDDAALAALRARIRPARGGLGVVE